MRLRTLLPVLLLLAAPLAALAQTPIRLRDNQVTLRSRLRTIWKHEVVVDVEAVIEDAAFDPWFKPPSGTTSAGRLPRIVKVVLSADGQSDESLPVEAPDFVKLEGTPQHRFFATLRLSKATYDRVGHRFALIGEAEPAEESGEPAEPGEPPPPRFFITETHPLDRPATIQVSSGAAFKPVYRQNIAGGNAQSVLQLPAHWTSSQIAKLQNEPVRLELDGTASTQGKDKSAGLNAGLRWNRLSYDDDLYDTLQSAALTARTNQIYTNRTYAASYAWEEPFRGSVAWRSTFAPMSPIKWIVRGDAEFRDAVDAEFDTYHGKGFVVVPSIGIRAPKLYPYLGRDFRKLPLDQARERLRTYPWLDLTADLYAFPGERRDPEGRRRYLDGRAVAELHVPLRAFPALRFVASYAVGAVPANNYTFSRTVGLELRYRTTRLFGW